MSNSVAQTDSYTGCKVSLITKALVRYEGIVLKLDKVEKAMHLSQVRSYGTEGRKNGQQEMPPRQDIIDKVVFKIDLVQNLVVIEKPGGIKVEQVEPGSVPTQPAKSIEEVKTVQVEKRESQPIVQPQYQAKAAPNQSTDFQDRKLQKYQVKDNVVQNNQPEKLIEKVQQLQIDSPTNDEQEEEDESAGFFDSITNSTVVKEERSQRRGGGGRGNRGGGRGRGGNPYHNNQHYSENEGQRGGHEGWRGNGAPREYYPRNNGNWRKDNETFGYSNGNQGESESYQRGGRGYGGQRRGGGQWNNHNDGYQGGSNYQGDGGYRQNTYKQDGDRQPHYTNNGGFKQQDQESHTQDEGNGQMQKDPSQQSFNKSYQDEQHQPDFNRNRGGYQQQNYNRGGNRGGYSNNYQQRDTRGGQGYSNGRGQSDWKQSSQGYRSKQPVGEYSGKGDKQIGSTPKETHSNLNEPLQQ